MLSITLHEESPAGDSLSRMRVEQNTIILNNFMLTLRKVGYDPASSTSYWHYTLQGICDGPALEAWAIGLPDPAVIAEASHDYRVVWPGREAGFAGIQFVHTIEPGRSGDFLLAVAACPAAAPVPVAVQVGGMVFSGWISGPQLAEGGEAAGVADPEQADQITGEMAAEPLDASGLPQAVEEVDRSVAEDEPSAGDMAVQQAPVAEENVRETAGARPAVMSGQAPGTEAVADKLVGIDTVAEKMRRLLQDMERSCATREHVLEELVAQLSALVRQAGKARPVDVTVRSLARVAGTAGRQECTHHNCPYYSQCRALFRE